MARRAGSDKLSGGTLVPESRLSGEARQCAGEEFKDSTVTPFKSKDIFRALQLSLLGVSNYHVEPM